MANPEHIKILEKGVDAWNKWRHKNPDIKPNLKALDCKSLNGTNLRRATFDDENIHDINLEGVNFTKANLEGANLSGAFLFEASFEKANLKGGDFEYAILEKANFTGANLSGAKFIYANLTSANLVGANLVGAELLGALLLSTEVSGADFSKVNIFETVFSDVNLSNVINLELCTHFAPATLDYRTLAQSVELPLSFLRGCGLPEDIINIIPALRGDPIQFYSCFISYSSKDDRFAKQLYADLQNKGIRCWFAPEELRIGDKTRSSIDNAIRIHDKLLLILSENSVESEWVEHEVENALEQEIKRKKTVLFPIRLDDAVMNSETTWAAKIKRERHIGDFKNWKKYDNYQQSLNRLIRDLKAERAEP